MESSSTITSQDRWQSHRSFSLRMFVSSAFVIIVRRKLSLPLLQVEMPATSSG